MIKKKQEVLSFVEGSLTSEEYGKEEITGIN